MPWSWCSINGAVNRPYRAISQPSIPVYADFRNLGPQDTGKNFMLEVFALVIGSWNYLSTTNLEVLYGNHAELAVGKLLVNMDEIDAHSTKPYQSRIKKDVDNQTKKHVNRKFERPRTEKTYGRIVGNHEPTNAHIRSFDNLIILINLKKNLSLLQLLRKTIPALSKC